MRTSLGVLACVCLFALQAYCQPFSITVSEIMYFPSSGSDLGDFIELKNYGTTDFDLDGYSIADAIDFTFSPINMRNGTILRPGQFLVIAKDPTTFEAIYSFPPNNTVAYEKSLSDNGELIEILDPQQNSELSFEFGTTLPWPLAPAGYGFTLVPKNTSAAVDLNVPFNWRASTRTDGSPGKEDPNPVIPEIIINEVLAHSDPPFVDFVEMYNPTSTSASIGGWYLSETQDLNQLGLQILIPANTVLPAGGYFTITLNENSTYRLSELGDTIVLVAAAGTPQVLGYTSGYSFGATDNNLSLGRYVNSEGRSLFVPQVPSQNKVNNPPLVGPLVISEIMHRPNIADKAYIGLTNILSTPLDLFDVSFPENTYEIVQGITVTFPAVTLAPGETIFCSQLAPVAFRQEYPLFANAKVFQYNGTLSSNEDTITITKPGDPELTGSVPRYPFETVSYTAQAPWPTNSQLNGNPLCKINLSDFGDDVAAWQVGTSGCGRVVATTSTSGPATTTASASSSTTSDAVSVQATVLFVLLAVVFLLAAL